MKPVKKGCCALAGKAGGAIRGRLELFGSFLFGAKKERKDKNVVKDAIKDFEKVIRYDQQMLKQVQHDSGRGKMDSRQVAGWRYNEGNKLFLKRSFRCRRSGSSPG